MIWTDKEKKEALSVIPIGDPRKFKREQTEAERKTLLKELKKIVPLRVERLNKEES